MYHFINCMVLAFAPHVIIYKATKLYVDSTDPEAATNRPTNPERREAAARQ